MDFAEAQKDTPAQWVPVGRVGKSHGLKGDFLLLGTEQSDLFGTDVQGTMVRISHGEVSTSEHALLSARWMHKGWVIRVSGVDSPEAAATLRGARLSLQLATVASTEGFFPEDIVGFRVQDAGTQQDLGVIEGIEYLKEAPDRWWIHNGDCLWSVPAVERFVVSVETAGRLVRLSNYESLRDLA